MLKILVKREFLIRYKDSVLGLMWVFGAPLIMIVTYSAFSFGLLGNLRTFSPGDLAGLFVCLGLWQWFSECVSRSTTAFHDNAALVKKTNIKLSLLPLTNVLVSMVGFTLPLCLGVVIAAVTQEWDVLPRLFFGVVAFVPWFIGVVFCSAVVGTFLRDARYALPMLVTVGFFLTPILYRMSDIGGILKSVVSWNPIAPIFDFIKTRGPISLDSLSGVAPSVCMGLVLLGFSLMLFKKREKEISDVV
jgi:lipopolysaccharide transport system permease protein